MTGYTVKAGTTRPAFKSQLVDDDGNALGLQNVTSVVFRLARPDDTVIVEKPATVQNAAEGRVRYEWAAGETTPAGYYYAEWELTYADGATATVPSNGYLAVEFEEPLGGGA